MKSIDMNENFQTLAGLGQRPPTMVPGDEWAFHAARPALTGEAARASFGSLSTVLQKNPQRTDIALPVSSRAQRRASDRSFARQKRKGLRSYMNRQLLEQRVVNDLQHSFDVLDGRIEVSPSVRKRIASNMADKAALLAKEHDLSTDEAEVRLRQMAGR